MWDVAHPLGATPGHAAAHARVQLPPRVAQVARCQDVAKALLLVGSAARHVTNKEAVGARRQVQRVGRHVEVAAPNQRLGVLCAHEPQQLLVERGAARQRLSCVCVCAPSLSARQAMKKQANAMTRRFCRC